MKHKLAIIVIAFTLVFPLFAEKKEDVGSCSPYFVSLTRFPVNMRIGPGEEYGVKYIYVQKRIPFLVVAKCNDWRKVIDPDGESGWILRVHLSMKRFVILKKDNYLYKKPQKDNNLSSVIIKKNVVCKFLSVNGNWSKIEHESGISGWVDSSSVFGIMNDEVKMDNSDANN